MTQQKQEFCLVGIYHNDKQRFVDSAEGETVTDALITLMQELHRDHHTYAGELQIIGVFAGRHHAKDSDMQYADVRPDDAAHPGSELKPFTVVSDETTHHVMATDAADAELEADEDECLEVGAVFEGHLKDISSQVDWERFYASIPKSEEDEEAEANA